MSEIADLSAEMADDRRAYFEQRIFVLSPLGVFFTVLLLFVLLFGSFLAISAAEQAVLFHDARGAFSIPIHTRIAFTLALMLCSALFVQRYTRVQERKDRTAFAAVLRPGAIERLNLMGLTPATARFGLATLIGLVVGAVASWPLYAYDTLYRPQPLYGVFAWFLVVTILLAASFTRGVELSHAGTQSANRAIREELLIDLLRIDTLSVWGRFAARFSLIWFTVSAVSCLFFVDSGLNAFTISMLVTFLAMGIFVFVRPMERVHHRIRAAKAVELERIRGQIDGLRQAAVADPSAATRLQGLLAYETRIAAAPEWPFDQTTLVRVGASALILTVPWFGQAIAAYLVDHFSRVAS
jgi:hypothetical protein